MRACYFSPHGYSWVVNPVVLYTTTYVPALMNYEAFTFYLKFICTFLVRFSIFLGQKKGKLNSRGA